MTTLCCVGFITLYLYCLGLFTDHHLAFPVIFEELKTRIRRGETREPFAGGELYYSGSRVKEEIVRIKGRINKNINILVRSLLFAISR